MVHLAGFEPAHPKIPDLKSGALDHSAIDAVFAGIVCFKLKVFVFNCC